MFVEKSGGLWGRGGPGNAYGLPGWWFPDCEKGEGR